MRRPTQPHELLEQELNILLQGGDGSPEAEVHGDGQSEDVKKRVRTIKNRLAAKKSREQARSYVQELESNLSRMRQQNEDLARRLAQAEAENEALKRGLKTPLCPITTAPVGNKNCDGEPAALPSLQLDAVLLALMPNPPVSKPKLPPAGAGNRLPVNPVGRPPVVPEPAASGATPVHFAHLPQYTGVNDACKKRKLSSISVPSDVAGKLSEIKKSAKRPEPSPNHCSPPITLDTSSFGFKQESSMEEPPQLVESPNSHGVSTPLSEGDDVAWVDDVVLDNCGDPGAMLEQLMKDEPASPLEGASGFFAADAAWCH